MKKFILLIAIVFAPNTTFPQQIELNGQVSKHNSKYKTGKIEYIQNTSIKAPFTKPTTTDINGNFQLEFVGIAAGTSIQLQVEKAGLEVVNSYDLQDVVINRKSPLRIFLAQKGQLANAQTELYNISKQSLFAKKDALIARLQKDNEDSEKALAELEIYFGHPVTDRFSAEKELIEKISTLEKKLPQFALDLAKQNLDFASDLYIKAYGAFIGGDIEKSIEILDATTLDSQYQSGRASISKGNELKNLGNNLVIEGNEIIHQTIDSYIFKANNLMSVFQFKDAISIYQKLINIYEENDFQKIIIANTYDKLAELYYWSGDYNTALTNQQKAIDIKTELLDSLDPELAVSYNFIAEIYTQLADFNNALKYHEAALKIRESSLDKNSLYLATTYNNLASLNRRMGNLDKANNLVTKAIEIWKNNNSDEATYGYSNKALILRDSGDYNEALKYQTLALEIDEKLYGLNHLRLASTYNNYANALSNVGDDEKSLEYQIKAVENMKKNLSSNHPELGISYFNLSRYLIRLGDFNTAQNYINLTIPIFENAYGKNHPYVANAYGILAEINTSNGEYEQAIEAQKKLISIKKSIEKIDPMELADAYYAMGVIYQRSGSYEESLSYHKQALDIRFSQPNTSHPKIGESYYEITQVHIKSEKFMLAIESLLKAIEIDKVNYTSDSPNYRFLAEDFILLSKLYLQVNDKEKAKTSISELGKIIDALDPTTKSKLESEFLALKNEIDN